jgi:hypothetical protein
MPAQKVSAECVAAGPVFTSTPMLPVAYVESTTLIGATPVRVRVRVVPEALPTRWNGVFSGAIGTWTDLRMVSVPLTILEMRSWLDPPEIR